ncbi:MAG: hypothetical protein K6B43_09995 [Treponema sp.]|nr:hypothetical protein [Treponema sp.]
MLFQNADNGRSFIRNCAATDVLANFGQLCEQGWSWRLTFLALVAEPHGFSHISKLGGRAMTVQKITMFFVIAALLLLGYPCW